MEHRETVKWSEIRWLLNWIGSTLSGMGGIITLLYVGDANKTLFGVALTSIGGFLMYQARTFVPPENGNGKSNGNRDIASSTPLRPRLPP